MNKPFIAAQFTATKWDTAEAKAKAANDLAAFVLAGMPESKWRKGIYHTLYQHLFSHIAHYDMHGFFGTWFSTAEQRAEWVRHALSAGSYGDPEYTWSDVEKVFAGWLRGSGLPRRFEQEAEQTIETRERAVLAVLKARYE